MLSIPRWIRWIFFAPNAHDYAQAERRAGCDRVTPRDLRHQAAVGQLRAELTAAIVQRDAAYERIDKLDRECGDFCRNVVALKQEINELLVSRPPPLELLPIGLLQMPAGPKSLSVVVRSPCGRMIRICANGCCKAALLAVFSRLMPIDSVVDLIPTAADRCLPEAEA